MQSPTTHEAYIFIVQKQKQHMNKYIILQMVIGNLTLTLTLIEAGYQWTK